MEVNYFVWLIFLVIVYKRYKWVGLAQKSRAVMGNFDFKYTIQFVENVFQNLVQEKWHHSFGIEFNFLLLSVRAKLLDDGPGTCFCQGVAGPWFYSLLKVREGESENGGVAWTLSNGKTESVCTAGLNICQDYPVTLDKKQNKTKHPTSVSNIIFVLSTFGILFLHPLPSNTWP